MHWVNRRVNFPMRRQSNQDLLDPLDFQLFQTAAGDVVVAALQVGDVATVESMAEASASVC
jgi:hypothetical protein